MSKEREGRLCGALWALEGMWALLLHLREVAALEDCGQRRNLTQELNAPSGDYGRPGPG